MLASEAELVAAFGRHVERAPRESFAPGSAGLLIIANELNLPGAGTGGSPGSADLLAVDDLGEVWLIEAKLARNPEINPLIRGVFEVLRGECGGESPVSVVRRKSRVPYGRGELLGLPASAMRLAAENG